MPTILFLCTGNYYRSRFAEELFNHRAAIAGLAWRATSRALAIERGVNNVGAISPLAVSALQARGVVVRGHARMPLPCMVSDLALAARIVALSETEHRDLMRERFPLWESRAIYWQVEDVGLASPDEALGLIAREVEAMLTAVCRHS
jgi:protein-tyrosine phosphatase